MEATGHGWAVKTRRSTPPETNCNKHDMEHIKRCVPCVAWWVPCGVTEIHNGEIAQTSSRDFQNKRWETTMRKTIFTVLTASLMATLTAQAAVASDHHRARAKSRTVAIEQLRDSNAYAAPRDIVVPSYRSSLDEGAMASGMAGH